MPFSCLRDIEITPEFSATKKFAIDNMRQTPTSHMYMQVGSRYWQDALEGSRPVFGTTDLPIGALRDATHNQEGERGILNSMTCGPLAQRLAAMDEDDRVAYVTHFVERVLPGIGDHIEGTHWHDWESEKWSQGDWAWYKRGEFMRIYPHAATPEGRVHFAGDQTSARCVWQDGAIFSGHRAARAVNEAVDNA